jgi:hypothetical protein
VAASGIGGGLPAMEILEQRLMLTAAMEVWGGNVDCRSLPDNCYSIDKQGAYVELGESNQANSAVAFSSGTAYAYYIIATRATVNIDTVQGSTGDYYNGSVVTGNDSNWMAIGGAPDGVYDAVGTSYSDQGTYAGYVVITNPGSWTGITVYTGSIKQIAQLNITEKAQYISGASGPQYSVYADLEDNGFITSATLISPMGVSYAMTQNGTGDWQYYTPVSRTAQADVDGEFGHGSYSLQITTPLGTTTTLFRVTTDGTASTGTLAMPSQAPVWTSMSNGQTNVVTDALFTWAPVTDAAVQSVECEAWDSTQTDIFDQPGLDPTSVSYDGGAWGQAGANYGAALYFQDAVSGTNADGYGYAITKETQSQVYFQTAGATPGPADLEVSGLSVSGGTYMPGSVVGFSVTMGNAGNGNAFAYFAGQLVPIYDEIVLSPDQTWGDSGNIVVARYAVGGVLGGDVTTLSGAQASFVVPSNAPAGSYYVGMMVDANGQVAESDKTNNITWSSTNDLVVSNPIVSLTTPAVSSSVTLGQAYTIQWAGGTSATTMQLWANGPNGWAEIAPSVAATAGSYSWSTAGQAHGWYCFAAQVNPGSGGAWYTSDSPDFMHVVDPTSVAPTITIISPSASNVSVTQGATCTITWTATDGSQAANTLHVSLWAYNVDTNGGAWFQVPGASWLDNTGSYAWNTTGYYHGWYCFSAHVWNGDAQGVDGSPGWLHLVEPAAQMPVFTFINPVPGKTITLGSIWDLKWTATIATQDVGKMTMQLWVEYVDTADDDTPVWTELAASLNPTTGVYAWDTSGLNPAYQYYGFAAWVGYGDVWVSATDPNWIRVTS